MAKMLNAIEEQITDSEERIEIVKEPVRLAKHNNNKTNS